MRHYESPLATVLKGGLAGLAGTAAMTVAMERGPQLLQRFQSEPADISDSQQESQEQDAGESSGEAPTAQLAGKVAAGVAEHPIDQETRQVAGQAIHWGYGIGWGAMYGILQSSLRLPHLLHGTIFGALLAVLGWQVEAGLKIAAPPTQQPLSTNIVVFVAHLFYGWATALTFRVLSASD